jgi:hypothetical protein
MDSCVVHALRKEVQECRDFISKRSSTASLAGVLRAVDSMERFLSAHDVRQVDGHCACESERGSDTIKSGDQVV